MSNEVTVPQENIQSKIYLIREQKIMLDSDLAELYEVETRALNQQVKRNETRFPEDFMFQLTIEEWNNLKSQNVTSSWGGRRKLPYVFTEHGVLIKRIPRSSASGFPIKPLLRRGQNFVKVLGEAT